MNAKVLLVDDMGGIRRSVSHLLKQAGLEVVEAENGRQALNELKSGEYKLVITDILMPEVDGGEVIRWLAAQGSQRPRIIAMSGGGSQSTADQALSEARSLADAVLLKPFARQALMGLVERYCA